MTNKISFPQSIINEMNESIASKDPIDYFKSLATAIEIMFDLLQTQEKQLQDLKEELYKIKTQSALAIQWEPKVAAEMLSKQIDIFRKDKDTYFQELDSFKKAYTEDRVTQNYHDFVKFWSDTLGWHPFLE
jgi:hypothetical protein